MQLTPHDKFYRKFRKPAEGKTLIVGSHIYGEKEDRRKLYPDAVGVDMLDGPGVDVVADLEDWGTTRRHLRPGGFAHIECRSVLEHSRRPWLMAQHLEKLLAPGGTLDIAAPFVWRFHSYGGDYFRYTAEGLRSLFKEIEWAAVMYATGRNLSKIPKLDGQNVDKAVYLARCEVLAWGTKA